MPEIVFSSEGRGPLALASPAAMRALLLLAVFLALPGCNKKEAAATGAAGSAAPSAPAPSKLGAQLVGKWNDQEDGTLAWEFLEGGKCKAFGNMDCQYELGAESGSVLKLRYKPMDTWEDVEVTFDGPDKASWKNLTEAKTDPDTATTKLARAK